MTALLVSLSVRRGTLPSWGADQIGRLAFETDTTALVEWNGTDFVSAGGGGSGYLGYLVESSGTLPEASGFVVVAGSGISLALPIDPATDLTYTLSAIAYPVTITAGGSDAIVAGNYGNAVTSVTLNVGLYQIVHLVIEDTSAWLIYPATQPGVMSATADFTMGNGNVLYSVDATSGDVTASSPSPQAGDVGVFKKTDSSGNTVTTPTADGAPYVLSVQYQSVTIQYDGSAWNITATYSP